MIGKKVNLDQKDKDILKLLLEDPRRPISDIAKHLGVQRDTVKYRIERFEKRGLIMKYHTILDPHTLGLETFMMVLIKTKPVSSEATDQFVRAMQQHSQVTHISRLIGSYDYLLQVAAADIAAFDATLNEIKTTGEAVIAEIELSNIIDGYKTDDFSGLIDNSN